MGHDCKQRGDPNLQCGMCVVPLCKSTAWFIIPRTLWFSTSRLLYYHTLPPAPNSPPSLQRRWLPLLFGEPASVRPRFQPIGTMMGNKFSACTLFKVGIILRARRLIGYFIVGAVPFISLLSWGVNLPSDTQVLPVCDWSSWMPYFPTTYQFAFFACT